MKKKFLFTLGVMFCLCSAQAQNQTSIGDLMEIPSDTGNSITIEQLINLLQSSSTAVESEPASYPLGRGLFKKHHIEQAIEICPNISRDKISQADLLSDKPIENAENTEHTGFGVDFGYSVIFIPGFEENDKLVLNKAGFAYSLGFTTSFTQNDRYGITCDFLMKVGIETCHNKKMGVGLDVMGGYGKTSGDIFWYNNIVEDDAPTSITPYTLWSWKYGGQLWLKTTILNNADVILFTRLIISPDPEDIQKTSPISYNLWKNENWGFGVIIRYRL